MIVKPVPIDVTNVVSIRPSIRAYTSTDTESQSLQISVTESGGNDGGDGMESRVAVLEEKNRTIESNIGDIKTNIRSMLIVSITLLLAIAGAFYGVTKDLHSTELKIIALDYKAEKIQNDVGSLKQEVREIKSDINSIKSSLEKLTKDK